MIKIYKYNSTDLNYKIVKTIRTYSTWLDGLIFLFLILLIYCVVMEYWYSRF